MGKRILTYSLLFLCLNLLLELMCRLVGFPTYQAQNCQIHITPNQFGGAHPTLGYRIYPGTFTLQLDKCPLQYQATHLPDSTRATHPPNPQYDSLARIHLYGCSFIYGHLLEDEQSLAWQLQQAWPQYHVKNYGVNGYGLAQIYLLLQQQLQSEQKPAKVIIAYASFHDERSSLSRNWRKAIVPCAGDSALFQTDMMMPCTRKDWQWAWDGEWKMQYRPLQYRPWEIAKYSAWAHAVECIVNYLQNYWLESHKVGRRVLADMVRMCQDAGVEVLVLGIWKDRYTKDSLAKAAEAGADTLDISLPLSPEYSFLPCDGHPNAKANEIYAKRILSNWNSQIEASVKR